MEWLVWIGILIIMAIQGRILIEVRGLQKSITEARKRAAQIAQGRIYQRGPRVEKPRTTVRDTNDLPTTGQIGKGLHFTRRDYNEEPNMPRNPDAS